MRLSDVPHVKETVNCVQLFWFVCLFELLMTLLFFTCVCLLKTLEVFINVTKQKGALAWKNYHAVLFVLVIFLDECTWV